MVMRFLKKNLNRANLTSMSIGLIVISGGIYFDLGIFTTLVSTLTVLGAYLKGDFLKSLFSDGIKKVQDFLSNPLENIKSIFQIGRVLSFLQDNALTNTFRSQLSKIMGIFKGWSSQSKFQSEDKNNCEMTPSGSELDSTSNSNESLSDRMFQINGDLNSKNEINDLEEQNVSLQLDSTNTSAVESSLLPSEITFTDNGAKLPDNSNRLTLSDTLEQKVNTPTLKK